MQNKMCTKNEKKVYTFNWWVDPIVLHYDVKNASNLNQCWEFDGSPFGFPHNILSLFHIHQVEEPVNTSPNSARHIKCKMQKHLQQLEILSAIKYKIRYISFVASLGF
jgi:hypothetical protein